MDIIKYGNPLLRKKAKAVDKITKDIIRLIDDMSKTLYTNVPKGVGLAAPQIGVSLQIIVVEVEPGKIISFINPEIIETKGKCTKTEGCLSIPGVYADIQRAKNIVLTSINPVNNKKITYRAEDFAARVIQHEIDHLNGVLFTDFIDKVNMLTIEEGYTIPPKLLAKYKK